MELREQKISCPYCGESIDVFFDDSVSESDYFEDCSVCCRPIRLKVDISYDGSFQLDVLRDDE